MRGADISINAMRRIDRLAGVPLCFLTTIILKLQWQFQRRPPRPIQRILFVELSEMGSTILAEPALRKVRKCTDAENYFVIFARNADALAITGTIDRRNVFTIRTNSLWHLAVDTLAFLLWTRRNAVDTVVDLELFSRFTGLLTGLSGADRRVGFYQFGNEGLYRGDMLTHRVAYNPHIHIAKNFIALVNSLLSEAPVVPSSKTVIDDNELKVSVRPASAAERHAAISKIKSLASTPDPSRLRWVLINPNAGEMLPQRRWLPNRFVELIRRILTVHDDVLVLIIGASHERAEAEKLAAQCGSDRCVAIAGSFALPDLPAIFSIATLMISNDSGPAHFAAACGLPTIVLFGPETPDLYRPLGSSTVIYAGLACSPCVNVSNHRKSACSDNVCMRAISVDQVFREAQAILTARSTKPLELNVSRKTANSLLPSLTVAKVG
ncbi:MAG TPA: glycosyltransferase family 9 protein, partial [Terriglobales bacterium]|nr:glycosyltransferase family 9 protein [Terriglobales bacterium]